MTQDLSLFSLILLTVTSVACDAFLGKDFLVMIIFQQFYRNIVSGISSSLDIGNPLSIKFIVSLYFILSKKTGFTVCQFFFIISNFVDSHIRKIFPFSFLQKINTIVSLCNVSLSRNFDFFF